jgi:hypothetical protein
MKNQPQPDDLRELAERLYQETLTNDPVQGVWRFNAEDEWVLYTDASGLALGAVLTIGSHFIEDGSWIRKKQCSMHINIAELEGALQGLKLVERLHRALGVEGKLKLKVVTDNAAVASWLLKADPEMVKCSSRTMVIHRLRKYSSLVEKLNLEVKVHWIASEENLADALTRVPEYLKSAYAKTVKPKTEKRISKARVLTPAGDFGRSVEISDSERREIVELLRGADKTGLGLGSIRQDVELESHACN